MTEQTTKRRGWVKNAIIIFLAVMLILVFFSNTIMNRSLPEVATQYTSSGQINAMIRGSGTATANESYDVKIDQTRLVTATYVRVGDQVEPDTLLFKLQDAESDELGSLRKELEDAEYNYQMALLDASVSGTDQNNRDIQRAKEDLEAAKAEMANLAAKYTDDLSAVRADIAALKTTVETKKAALDKAQEALEALGGLDNGNIDPSGYQNVLSAKAEYESKVTEYQSVLLRYGAEDQVLRSIAHDLYAARSGASANYTESAFLEALTAEFGATGGTVIPVPDTDAVFERCADGLTIRYPNSASGTVYTKKTLADAHSKVSAAETARDTAKRSYESAENSYYGSVNYGNSYEYNKLKKARDEAQTAYNTVNKELEEKTAFLTDYTAARDKVYTLSDTLENLLVQQKQLSVSQSKTALGLERQHKDIEALREKIAAMEAGGTVTEVYANVSGVVRSVNVSSGNKAPADSAMATIDVVDRGYSLTMAVTAEQASKVRVGDEAEVSGNYWGSKISATLVSIRNDPNKPGEGKLLLFSLTGDVENGSVLNIAIGQRSQYYDVIVPNSAIREDTDGNYVFVVEAKNSPLGNRYFANRVNVTVLAKDDNNAAVAGSLSGWNTSVITSAPPIKSGTQVRLAENG